MKIAPSDFGQFFTIGRELGWDPEKWEWTVKDLVNPAGIPPKLKEITNLDPEMSLEWSGESRGPLKVRECIIESHEYDLEPENLLLTHGTQHAQFLATIATVDAGDEVIIDPPTWMKHQQVAETLGAIVKPLYRKESLEWNFSIEELNELTSSKTKQIFLCSPNNPTGAVLQEKEMRAICEIAEDCDAYVLSDEIYRGLEYDGNIASCAAHLYEKAISMSSVSKTTGMDGLRIGWIVSQDKELLNKCIAFKSIDTGDANSRLDESVLLVGLEPTKFRELTERSLSLGLTNRQLVADWIAKYDEWNWIPPKAGYLSFPRYDINISSWDLCTTLLKDPYRVYLFPGSLYGFENHLRLGWGGWPPEEIKAGLERLDMFMETI